jgi:undecaprenyl-diphosphatase
MRWVALAVFAWLAILVGRGKAIFFDEPVREAVHAMAAPALTTVMEAFTWIGAPRVAWVLTVVCALLGWRWNRNSAIRFLVVMAGAAVLELSIKLVFHRARPSPFFGFQLPESYSFPSGHALYAACLYGCLASLATGRRVMIWIGAGLLIALIGVSRIYLGVHYPSDVLAGWSIGWFWMRSVVMARKAA